MRLARFSLAFLIYSSLLFIGTPPLLLALQMLSLGGAGVALLAVAVRRRTLVFPPVFLIYFAVFMAFIAISMLVATAGGQTPPPIMLRFAQVFLTTLAAPMLVYGYDRLGIAPYGWALNHIVYAMVAYSALKFLIMVIVGVTHTSVLALDVLFIDIFNTAPTTGGESGGIFRFMAPADFLDPFVLYFLLLYRSGWFKWLSLLVVGLSLYITISRFIWLEGAFALGLCFFSLSRKSIFIALVALLVVAPPVLTAVYPVIEKRFLDPGSAKSDDLRLQQSEALTMDSDDYMLLGHGFGSFTYKMIRDFKAPYNYEVQWLEITYQMGVVGLLLVLGLLIFAASPLLMSRSLAAVPVVMIFIFSLMSGFANPSLFGRTAGVWFTFVYCFGRLVQDRAQQARQTERRPPAVGTTPQIA